MKKLGSELEIICQIKGDGSGVLPVEPEFLTNPIHLRSKFKLRCLSMSNKTFIASGFSTYVVKIKKKKDENTI